MNVEKEDNVTQKNSDILGDGTVIVTEKVTNKTNKMISTKIA